MRIFLSGIRKLVGRPASLVTVGLLSGLLILIMIATATVSGRSTSAQGEARPCSCSPSREPTT